MRSPDAIWLPNENKNPTDETFHRCLHGQADDDGADTERGQRRVPFHEMTEIAIAAMTRPASKARMRCSVNRATASSMRPSR